MTKTPLVRLFELHARAAAALRTGEALDLRPELAEIAAPLPCHTIDGRAGDVYLRRYGVAELAAGGGRIYLHNILRSDEDQELHGHPWPAHCYILAGGYREERRIAEPRSLTGYRVSTLLRESGSINILEPDTYHRVDLLEADAWSLCITGPKIVVADGEATWSFWDRETGTTTPWREFITAKGMVPTPTPRDLIVAR